MMGYSDLTNDFGDMNWGFFMQGYDMNNMAGLGAGFAPYPVDDPNLAVVPAPQDALPSVPLQQPPLQPPPPASNNAYNTG